MSQHLKTIFSRDRSRVHGDTFPRKKDVKRFAIWSYPRCEYDSHHILAPIMFGEPLENVFYLNSVETLSTAMELSVLSAKNIATLIAAKLSA
mmetsp:Transcript_32454/g.52015  ORF Transcript_32454/g.52015 Transcript_32454/m.52015 type:complete len:92 (-) Transcript_32454:40-315(-)